MKILLTTLCVLSLCSILVFSSVFGQSESIENQQYFRIHIRANSDLEIDQSVKYKVKDAVVDYLVPFLASAHTKSEAENIIQIHLTNIENVANNVLKNCGFLYVSKAKISNENFPTRTYGNLTLESGFYDSLIVELGNGKGQNWWCVVYPPLCFVNGSTKVSAFKSRIIEIIENFFN